LKKGCITCALVDKVNEDGICPKLLSCIAYVNEEKIFKEYVPKNKDIEDRGTNS